MAAQFGAVAARGIGTLAGSGAVDLPSGTVNGDLLIVWCFSVPATGTVTWSQTDGSTFTKYAENTSTAIATAVFYRVCDGSESSTFTFSRGAATTNNALILCARYLAGTFDRGNPLASANANGSSGTTCVLGAVTPVRADTLFVQGCATNGTGSPGAWTAPGSQTIQANNATATGTALFYLLADEVIGTGSSGTRTWTHATSGSTHGVSVAISPPVTASATLAGSGALSASGLQQVPSSVGMAGSSTLSASGLQQIPSSVAMSGSSTLSASGLQEIAPSVGMVGSSTLSASGLQEIAPSVGMAGSSTLSASGLQQIQPSAGLDGSSTLSASGEQEIAPSVLMAGSSGLAASVAVERVAGVSMDGGSTLTSTPSIGQFASAGLDGSGELSVSGLQRALAAAALVGSSSLSASGEQEVRAAVVMAGVGLLASTGLDIVRAGALLSGLGTLMLSSEFVYAHKNFRVTDVRVSGRQISNRTYSRRLGGIVRSQAVR